MRLPKVTQENKSWLSAVINEGELMMSVFGQSHWFHVFCLRIRDERCSVGLQILAVSGGQELSAILESRVFSLGRLWLKVPWRVLSCRKYHGPGAGCVPPLFSPITFSCLLLEYGSGDIFCEGFCVCPSWAETVCAGEGIPGGSGSWVAVAQGTHTALVYAEEVEAPNNSWSMMLPVENAAERIQITLLY